VCEALAYGNRQNRRNRNGIAEIALTDRGKHHYVLSPCLTPPSFARFWAIPHDDGQHRIPAWSCGIMMQIFTRSVASKKEWVSMAVLATPIGHFEIAMVDAAFPGGKTHPLRML